MLIDDGEALQLLTIGAGVKHKVVRLHVVRLKRRNRSRPGARNTPPRPLSRHLQPGKLPQAIRPIWAHLVPAASQEDVDAPVPIPGVLAGEIPHHRHHRAILRLSSAKTPSALLTSCAPQKFNQGQAGAKEYS